MAGTVREKAAGLGKTLTEATAPLRDNPVTAKVLKVLSTAPTPIAPLATIVRSPALTNGVGELVGGAVVTSANVTERWALPVATSPINPVGPVLGRAAAAAGIDPWAEVKADYARDPVGTAIEDASVVLSAIPIPGVGAAAGAVAGTVLRAAARPLVAAARPAITAAGKVLGPVAGKIGDWGRKLFDRTKPGIAARPANVPDVRIVDAQFGKKIGKHAQDYGLDPGDPAARTWLRGHIDDIGARPDEVRQGAWHSEGGGGTDYHFFRGGDDVVVTKGDGTFVTLLKGGANNQWFGRAQKVN